MNIQQITANIDEYADKYSEDNEVKEYGNYLLQLQSEYKIRTDIATALKILALGSMFLIGAKLFLVTSIILLIISILTSIHIENSYGILLDEIIECNCEINSRVWELILQDIDKGDKNG